MNGRDLDLGQTIRGFTAGQKLFGRFVLKAVLDRGGIGIVWPAWDEQLERDVAWIETLLPEFSLRAKRLLWAGASPSSKQVK